MRKHREVRGREPKSIFKLGNTSTVILYYIVPRSFSDHRSMWLGAKIDKNDKYETEDAIMEKGMC